MNYKQGETVNYAWVVTNIPRKVQNIKGKEFIDSVQTSGGNQNHILMSVRVHTLYTSYGLFFMQSLMRHKCHVIIHRAGISKRQYI